MPHLIPPYRDRQIPKLRQELIVAHRYLATAARSHVVNLNNLALGEWGRQAKRMPCILPEAGRPAGMECPEHNFVEVLNQCANLERLLDTLAWVEDQEDFATYKVELCHPTTSSQPGTPGDNDLVLRPTAESPPGSERAFFEVTDVVGKKDGNGKQKKSLRALGVLQKNGTKYSLSATWPSARLFVACSPELAGKLDGRGIDFIRKMKAFRYERRRDGGAAGT